MNPSINPAIALPLESSTIIPINPKITARPGINQPSSERKDVISRGKDQIPPILNTVLNSVIATPNGIQIIPKIKAAVPNPFPIVFT